MSRSHPFRFSGTLVDHGDFSSGRKCRVILVRLDDGAHEPCIIRCDPQGDVELPPLGTRVYLLRATHHVGDAALTVDSLQPTETSVVLRPDPVEHDRKF